MLDDIATELVKALQENLEDFPAQKVVKQRPSAPKPADLPLISVSSDSFTFVEAGIGVGSADLKVEASQTLSGDGKTLAFTLTDKPVKPLISVETPKGRRRLEPTDYSVDYPQSVITFSAPPAAGTNNIIVRYRPTSGAGESKNIQMNISYDLDVWAKDETQRDLVTVQVIKAMALSEEGLSAKGIRVTPAQGMNIDAPEGWPAGIFAKRLVYSAEANLQVKVPITRMEKITIEQKKPE